MLPEELRPFFCLSPLQASQQTADDGVLPGIHNTKHYATCEKIQEDYLTLIRKRMKGRPKENESRA